MATPTYELIATQTLASSASSVTFSSITQDYRDLVLVIEFVNTTSTNVSIYLRFNNDTGANYSSLYARGYNVSNASGSKSSVQYINLGDQVPVKDGNKNLTIASIQDYSQTDKHTSVISRSNTPSLGVNMVAGRWANTSAVTQLDLVQSSGTGGFSAGSTFSLYGIAA